MQKRHILGARHTAALLLVSILLAACGGGGGGGAAADPAASTEMLETQLITYATSLREEADWLWDNATYLQTSTLPVPDEERCADREFKHTPVVLDPVQEEDTEIKHAVDLLNYVGELNASVRTQWGKFCQRQADAPSSSAFMRSYLTTAYSTLDDVERTAQRRIIQATDAASK